MSLVLAAAAAVAVPTLLAPASSELNDYNLGLDAAEQMMVFARSQADFKHATIFTTARTGAGWSEPVPIEFSDPAFSDSDPWLTPDGATLYFISDRPAPGREAGRADFDIWRARRTAAGWSAPEHLGPEVNSQGQELGPELHGGTLYFASARRSGLGGLDIYAAEADGREFRPPALVEGPFNSSASDSDFTLSAEGSAAMFWRSVPGGGAIHVAYRTGGQWSRPVMLGADVNVGPFNFTPAFSTDGRRVRYASTRVRHGQPAGHADIYETALPAR